MNVSNTKFLQSPIQELVEYGLTQRMVNLLEEQKGIFIKDLANMTEEDVNAMWMVSKVQLAQLKDSLRKFYEHCLEQTQPLP